MDYKDQFLTPTAWLIVVLMSVIAFGIYYLVLLPEIVTSYENSFFIDEEMDKPDGEIVSVAILKIETKHPRYIGEFESQPMQILISVPSISNLSGIVKLEITGHIYGEKGDLCEFQKIYISPTNIEQQSQSENYKNYGFQEKYDKEINLKQGETVILYLDLKLPTIPTEQESSSNCKSPKFVVYEIIVRQGEIIIIQTKNGDSITRNPAITNVSCENWEKNGVFCSTIDNFGVFRQSASKQLLLPPWSSGFLPLFVFGITWVVDRLYRPCHRILRKKVRTRFTLPRMIYLFIFVTLIIHLIVYEMEIVFLKNEENDLKLLLQFLWIPGSLFLLFILCKQWDNFRRFMTKCWLKRIIVGIKKNSISAESIPQEGFGGLEKLEVSGINDFSVYSIGDRVRLLLKIIFGKNQELSKKNWYLLEMFWWHQANQPYFIELLDNEFTKMDHLLTLNFKFKNESDTNALTNIFILVKHLRTIDTKKKSDTSAQTATS